MGDASRRRSRRAHCFPGDAFTPGTNGAGTVEAVGPGVFHLRSDQRVDLNPHFLADERGVDPRRSSSVSPDQLGPRPRAGGSARRHVRRVRADAGRRAPAERRQPDACSGWRRSASSRSLTGASSVSRARCRRAVIVNGATGHLRRRPLSLRRPWRRAGRCCRPRRGDPGLARWGAGPARGARRADGRRRRATRSRCATRPAAARTRQSTSSAGPGTAGAPGHDALRPSPRPLCPHGQHDRSAVGGLRRARHQRSHDRRPVHVPEGLPGEARRDGSGAACWTWPRSRCAPSLSRTSPRLWLTRPACEGSRRPC